MAVTTYTPNFAKTPLENLIGLINARNDKGFDSANFKYKDYQELAEASAAGNTHSIALDLDADPSEVEGDYETFEYTPMPLATVWSLLDAANVNRFRELEYALDAEGLPVDSDAFRAYILSNFGFYAGSDAYDLSVPSAGVIRFTPTAANVAYTGTFDIKVVNSLATRVATTTLSGFDKDSTTAYVAA